MSHDAVLLDKRVFLHNAVNITTGDEVADLEVGRGELPLLCPTECVDVDTLRDVDGVVGHARNLVERALDPVENTLQDTRAELERERLAGPEHRVADSDAGGLLIRLNGGLVAFESDDLTDEHVVPDTDELIHRSARHALGNNDCEVCVRE